MKTDEKNKLIIMSDIIWWIVIIVVFFVFWGILFPKVYKKAGQSGEKNTLRIIKRFIKKKGWKKQDYLLTSNLILQKANYWSCEIDILLVTRKWVYIIEVKDWKRGLLSGKLNSDYLEWSYKVGGRRKRQRHQMYSPFYQNEQHVRRFKNFFQLANNRNILSVICFNSPALEINLKKNARSIFESKHLWVKNGQNKNIANLLAYCEKQNTQLLPFQQLRRKIIQEILTTDPRKTQKHQAWVKSLKREREAARDYF